MGSGLQKGRKKQHRKISGKPCSGLSNKSQYTADDMSSLNHKQLSFF